MSDVVRRGETVTLPCTSRNPRTVFTRQQTYWYVDRDNGEIWRFTSRGEARRFALWGGCPDHSVQSCGTCFGEKMPC